MTSQIFLGTQGWSFKSWVGNFYPPGTAANAYLKEYAQHFSAIEIDSTYYGTPRATSVKQWREATPEHFRFTAKFPQIITHEKMLKQVEHETLEFLDTMDLLGDKLGPLLIQFPYTFKPDQRETLAKFLDALPTHFRYAVEIRHRGWLTDEFFDLLTRHRIALALADYAYMPQLDRATTDFTYMRWLGNRQDIPDDAYDRVRINRDKELEHWAGVMDRMLEQGIDVWGFANNHYQGHSPATIQSLMEHMKK